MIGAFLVNRIPTCSVAGIAAGGLALREDEEGWQDKEPRCAARSVGCFSYSFRLALHCASENHDVHPRNFPSLSNRNRTAQAIICDP